MKQGRTLHLRFQSNTTGLAIAANESGRILRFAALPTPSEVEYFLCVAFLRRDVPALVTAEDYLVTKSQWERDRRNLHYCSRQVFDWTLHCEPRGKSLHDMLKFQAAVYHGIQNESRFHSCLLHSAACSVAH